ncbi:MAG TPA: hypothetical protein VI912_02625, partial [Candidatus Bilamarchaeaceae archaeon]|nr:hypothetical protein [Candidatus Bilamarchaeaceae archaeon]
MFFFELVSIDAKGVTLQQSIETGMSEFTDATTRVNFEEPRVIGEFLLSFTISAEKGDKEGEAILTVRPSFPIVVPFLAIAHSAIQSVSENASLNLKKGDILLNFEFVFEWAGNATLTIANVTKEGVELKSRVEIFMSEHPSSSNFVKFGGTFEFAGFEFLFEKGDKPGATKVTLTKQPEYEQE